VAVLSGSQVFWPYMLLMCAFCAQSFVYVFDCFAEIYNFSGRPTVN